jgi:predicted nuclease of predicted toxin-antitoxin system
VSRFLVDNQLPVALAGWLRDQGHVAEHALELDLAQAPDRLLWHYAAEHDAVIVTKDEDFAQMVTLRPEPVPVVWLRIGNCRTPALLALFAAALPALTEQLANGTRLIEVR